jgi:DNA-binding CsgD family transcriptional regulator
LVDAFTAAGSRYVVAYENPAGDTALRALSLREQTVLDYVLAGRSGKWIALELGLSEPTVARTIRWALRRLGVSSTSMLAGVRSAQFESLDGIDDGRELMVARQAATLSFAALSRAELDVATGILNGMPMAAIARARGARLGTVAHQASSIYRKVGVSSRRELVARFGESS